jgi:hypothetical protein
MIGLDQKMDVYQEDPGSGAFTTPLAAGVSCRVATVSTSGAQTRDARAQLTSMRLLMWDAGYQMPETSQVQIEVEGERYNPVSGTYVPRRGPNGAVMFRICDLVKVVV